MEKDVSTINEISLVIMAEETILIIKIILKILSMQIVIYKILKVATAK